MYSTEFRRIRIKRYSNYAEVVTDWLKTEVGVGAAAIIGYNRAKCATLLKDAT